MHQVPYRKIDYHLGLDHEAHDVTYFGTADSIAEIPEPLRCGRVVLDGPDGLAEQIIARTRREDGWEQVLALSEFGILEAAAIREHLGIPGPERADLELIRDKVAMKQALVDADVRHPRFVAAPPALGRLPWTGRTVVKPRLGASSDGVTVHATAEEAVAHHRGLPDREAYQLEEYVEGELLHADGLVTDGRVSDLVVSRYVGKPVDFAAGAPIATGQLPPDPRHTAFTEQVVEALRIAAGCIHLEFFETAAGELVFLEVANRLGGGGIVTSHLRHTGVHLARHEIAIRLGLPRPDRLAPSGRYHGFAIFPGHRLDPSRPWRTEVPEHLREHPALDRLHLLDDPGTDPEGGSARITYQEWQVPAFIEASHPDPDELARFLADCTRSIRVSQPEPAHTPGGPRP
ncbi:ATP-grasp domain-containing protein [Streptomyces sp. 1331.2]|uniref:ATP-grasp domain-containing protein n=1 Tax=Streptomyces sp. 1331.2 TaxID=1938835 RepID=UPI001C54401E|nr:hypothetical protein [Streptomyces sp. 1331.2]